MTRDGELSLARKPVRDLLWVASSPHMISGALHPVLPASFGSEALRSARVREWLTTLDADPQPLLSFLQGTRAPLPFSLHVTAPKRGSLALGVYFSALLEFWLRRCPAFRVERFTTGTQIVSATNQTIGQLKFLFRCEVTAPELQHATSHKPVALNMHVESSVKFFLLHPVTPHRTAAGGSDEKATVSHEQNAYFPLEQFVGPHLGENLAWRVQEVARKLDMCRGAAVSAWLHSQFSSDVSSFIVLRGYLFYPLRLFASTSAVTRGHDWSHHRNTSALSPWHASDGDGEDKCAEGLPPCHPGIASDHLSGWWTTDFEKELPTKVAANERMACGESRFVVLPKLHWLSPIIATEEVESGHVFVDGERVLGAERVNSMTLDELMIFARTHFENLVRSPTETQAKGAVVMPLLVAEIIRCRPVDREYSATVARWKELSRGFVLDPRCWDPTPLCSEPVRFRKVSQRVDHATLGGIAEREYAGRKEWRHDGVVKPTEHELELASSRGRRPRLFSDPASVSAPDLITRLSAALTSGEMVVTRTALKTGAKEVLLAIIEGSDAVTWTPIEMVSDYVRRALTSLVFDLPLLAQEIPRKQAQHVGHLVLDAFESTVPGSTHAVHESGRLHDAGAWTHLLLRVGADRSRWDFLNLVLRALQLIRERDASTAKSAPTSVLHSQFDGILESLLIQGQSRWNTVAVDMLDALRGSEGESAAQKRAREIFGRLVDQQDWPNVERLAITARDAALFQESYELFSRRSMVKAMKRLRKSDMARLALTTMLHSQVPSVSACSGNPAVIDHLRNREIAGLDVALEHWEYVCSTAQLRDLAAFLASLDKTIQTSSMQGEHIKQTVVGLDCEWRPQAVISSAGVTDRAKDHALGVSVYQLAVGGRVFVVDVQTLGADAAAPLRFLWRRSSPFLLAGFCVSSDLTRLAQSFPELNDVSDADSDTEIRLLELKRLAAFRGVPVDNWGLSRLYHACFGQQLDKEQQCSDWSTRPLTPQQLAYAAMDAHAVRNVALHLVADLELEDGQVAAAWMRQLSPGRLELFAVRPSEADDAPLGKRHVHAALKSMGLERVVRFLSISADLWSKSSRHESGLVVKTIAVVAKRAPSDGAAAAAAQMRTYAAVVLELGRSIDMRALAVCMNASSPDHVALADRRTLRQVFGYARGCIGPIGLRQQAAIRVIVDRRLEGERRLLCGAGVLDEVYAIAPAVLIRTTGATAAAISTHCD